MCASATLNPTFIGTLTRCVQRPRLNFDILLEVCKFLPEVRDIISLSTTCFDLRRPSVRHLLLSRTVVVNYDDALGSFFQFIFDAEGIRPALLRDLKIKLRDPSDQFQPRKRLSKQFVMNMQGALQTILMLASNLQRLDLGGPSYHPHLSRSLSYMHHRVSCVPFRLTPELIKLFSSSVKTLKGLILPIKPEDDLDAEDDVDEAEAFRIEQIYLENLYQFVGRAPSKTWRSTPSTHPLSSPPPLRNTQQSARSV